MFSLQTHFVFKEVESRYALKEWAITCEALAQGRQIVLLRKGGLLDEDGSFSLESNDFFLLPSWFHAERSLVKPSHLDLWEQTPREDDEGPKIGYLRHFARVENLWRLDENAEAALRDVTHIWGQSYLDLRYSYQSEKLLLCAALRVWTLDSPLRYPLRTQDVGCRSWIEWDEPQVARAAPVLSDEEFQGRLEEVARILG